MTKNNLPNKSWPWREYVSWLRLHLITSTNYTWTRRVIIVVLFIVFIWLVLTTIYSSLNQPITLPLNIEQENLSLDLTTLQAINTQRVQRTKRQMPNYLGYAAVFIRPVENE